MNIENYYNLKHKFNQKGGEFDLLQNIDKINDEDLQKIKTKCKNVKRFNLADIKPENITVIEEEKQTYKLTINSIMFTTAMTINNGSNGIVYLMQNTNNEVVALKVGIIKNNLNPNKKDIEIIKKLNETCNDFYIKSLYDLTENYIIMDYADGTLNELNKINIDIADETKIYILKKVFESIKCLIDNDLYYTDLKLLNVLFMCKDDEIKILLGDLGSITENTGNAVSTYPHPNRCHNIIDSNKKLVNWCGSFNNPNQYDVLWSYAITCLSFFNINIKIFEFNSIKNAYMTKILSLPTSLIINMLFNKRNEHNITNDLKNINIFNGIKINETNTATDIIFNYIIEYYFNELNKYYKKNKLMIQFFNFIKKVFYEQKDIEYVNEILFKKTVTTAVATATVATAITAPVPTNNARIARPHGNETPSIL